jgi:hypothetical protein
MELILRPTRLKYLLFALLSAGFAAGNQAGQMRSPLGLTNCYRSAID